MNYGHLRCSPALTWHTSVKTRELLQRVVIHTLAGEPPARCWGLLRIALGFVPTGGT